MRNIRSSVCVQQDVPVLEVLRLGPRLQMLLQAVAAIDALADGRDGRLVDGGSFGSRHGGCVGETAKELQATVVVFTTAGASCILCGGVLCCVAQTEAVRMRGPCARSSKQSSLHACCPAADPCPRARGGRTTVGFWGGSLQVILSLPSLTSTAPSRHGICINLTEM